METTTLLEPDAATAHALPGGVPATPPRRRPIARLAGALWRGLASAIGWLFGLASLAVGLSVLAAVPVVQFLSLGYLLESSARVAISGRLRDGFIGIREAGRIGRAAIGTFLATLPLALASSYSHSADLIVPGGTAARNWHLATGIVAAMTLVHVSCAYARGAGLRHFLWPLGTPFWLLRQLRAGGLYARTRDGFWSFVDSLAPGYYFRLGLVGFLGTAAWLIIPASLIAAAGRFPPLGFLGVLLLAIVAPSLPFLQVRYAVDGDASALFSLRSARERFRRAPWAFAFALMILLLASVPLYLLKIEMIPREAAWLESLVFVVFLAPAHLLVGWAYSRSGRRVYPRHWTIRLLGRLAIVPTSLFYVLIVFLSQFTSWGGIWSLYEQHAFLLPVPFLSM
ncbi:hypothetical protein OJF2_61430 [Aquisphaera giovannonii]|uniref:DUF4013 domain-containing protein n=1 Tax=Aquisphaera giovannonii TaxID=406548 RepID=A0A5B9WAF0_9BACT|nr:hypothetical protein [Aquisphaera giovannonii]QEH37552.1 hypothetical protein OJF2_61430 [Aquisphaera giovannonii]